MSETKEQIEAQIAELQAKLEQMNTGGFKVGDKVVTEGKISRIGDDGFLGVVLAGNQFAGFNHTALRHAEAEGAVVAAPKGVKERLVTAFSEVQCAMNLIEEDRLNPKHHDRLSVGHKLFRNTIKEIVELPEPSEYVWIKPRPTNELNPDQGFDVYAETPDWHWFYVNCKENAMRLAAALIKAAQEVDND